MPTKWTSKFSIIENLYKVLILLKENHLGLRKI